VTIIDSETSTIVNSRYLLTHLLTYLNDSPLIVHSLLSDHDSGAVCQHPSVRQPHLTPDSFYRSGA